MDAAGTGSKAEPLVGAPGALIAVERCQLDRALRHDTLHRNRGMSENRGGEASGRRTYDFCLTGASLHSLGFHIDEPSLVARRAAGAGDPV